MPVAALVPVAASVPAWTGIHSAAWGSCTATAVVDTDIGTDTGISPCMGLALAWVWARSQEVWTSSLLVAWTGTHNSMAWGSCTAKRAAGMDMGKDAGISPCMGLALSWEILVDQFWEAAWRPQNFICNVDLNHVLFVNFSLLGKNCMS